MSRKGGHISPFVVSIWASIKIITIRARLPALAPRYQVLQKGSFVSPLCNIGTLQWKVLSNWCGKYHKIMHMSYLVQNVNFGGYLEYATILYVAAKFGNRAS